MRFSFSDDGSHESDAKAKTPEIYKDEIAKHPTKGESHTRRREKPRSSRSARKRRAGASGRRRASSGRKYIYRAEPKVNAVDVRGVTIERDAHISLDDLQVGTDHMAIEGPDVHINDGVTDVQCIAQNRQGENTLTTGCREVNLRWAIISFTRMSLRVSLLLTFGRVLRAVQISRSNQRKIVSFRKRIF